MPIEIKELHIKAIVSGNKRPADTDNIRKDLEKLKREVIKECVQEVLQILENKTER